MFQRLQKATHATLGLLGFLCALVSVYYWLQFWLAATGPYYMSRGLTWLLFAAILIGGAAVIDHYGSV
jgi:hypothetical protein